MDLQFAPSQSGPAAKIYTHDVVAFGRAFPPSVAKALEDQTSRFGIGVCRMWQRENSMENNTPPPPGSLVMRYGSVIERCGTI